MWSNVGPVQNRVAHIEGLPKCHERGGEKNYFLERPENLDDMLVVTWEEDGRSIREHCCKADYLGLSAIHAKSPRLHGKGEASEEGNG